MLIVIALFVFWSRNPNILKAYVKKFFFAITTFICLKSTTHIFN